MNLMEALQLAMHGAPKSTPLSCPIWLRELSALSITFPFENSINKSQRLLVALATLVLSTQAAHAASAPENFLYMGSGDLAAAKAKLARPNIGGVQVVFNWKSLETAKGQYDFSGTMSALAALTSCRTARRR
ncbi:hypothetical protein GCM10010520_34560 [Rhizobium viscosum]|uniref:Uncharacterized protein n=1 Tax=Rhizobium viscosum TaxID=1673 RepID=A0ABR9IRP9_RHIVS|nr:hypothetical protein [Rhizobium viscosum]MBE1505862.1 hypothetical protein [Rhizobium viscosum]